MTQVAWLPLDQQTIWWETRPTVRNFTIGPTSLIPREVWRTVYVTIP